MYIAAGAVAALLCVGVGVALFFIGRSAGKRLSDRELESRVGELEAKCESLVDGLSDVVRRTGEIKRSIGSAYEASRRLGSRIEEIQNGISRIDGLAGELQQGDSGAETGEKKVD